MNATLVLSVTLTVIAIATAIAVYFKLSGDDDAIRMILLGLTDKVMNADGVWSG